MKSERLDRRHAVFVVPGNVLTSYTVVVDASQGAVVVSVTYCVVPGPAEVTVICLSQ